MSNGLSFVSERLRRAGWKVTLARTGILLVIEAHTWTFLSLDRP